MFVPNLIRLSSDLVIPVLFAVSVLYSIYMPVQYKFGYDKSKLIFMFLLIAFPLFIAKANTTMIMEVLSNITIPVMLILALAALALSVMVSAKIFNGKGIIKGKMDGHKIFKNAAAIPVILMIVGLCRYTQNLPLSIIAGIGIYGDILRLIYSRFVQFMGVLCNGV